jgi:hypothetical protein
MHLVLGVRVEVPQHDAGQLPLTTECHRRGPVANVDTRVLEHILPGGLARRRRWHRSGRQRRSIQPPPRHAEPAVGGTRRQQYGMRAHLVIAAYPGHTVLTVALDGGDLTGQQLLPEAARLGDKAIGELATANAFRGTLGSCPAVR